MRDQIHAQNDAQVYFENPFVTRLLKRDGEIGIHGPTSMTIIVKNYLNHNMVTSKSIILKFYVDFKFLIYMSTNNSLYFVIDPSSNKYQGLALVLSLHQC
jgi:hypothetical protein